MTATYCLGGFAQTIRALKPDSWREALSQIPEKCTRGCGVDCRKVCRDYAAMQYRISKGRGRK
jgi:hypothetical protein